MDDNGASARTVGERAYRWVGREIERAIAAGHGSLPPVRTMARAAGLSASSITRAALRYQHEGVLDILPRSGIRLAGQKGCADEIRAEDRGRHRWRALRRQLQTDILTGKYTVGGQLPTRKELCRIYGVSLRTVQKVLESLSDRGILSHLGRGFTVAGISRSPGTRPCIVYIGRAQHDRPITLFGSRMVESIDTLDRETGRLGLRLRLAPYMYGNQRLRSTVAWDRLSPAQVRRQSILGFIVDGIAVEDRVGPLLNTLARFDLPVSVLFDHPQIEVPSLQELNPRGRSKVTFVVLDNNRRAGRRIARYAFSQGHRGIAFVRDAVGERQALETLAGIRDEAEELCGDATVADVDSLGVGINRELAGTILPSMHSAISTALSHRSPSSEALARHLSHFSFDDNAIAMKHPVLRHVGPEVLPTVDSILARPELTLVVCVNEAVSMLLYYCFRARGLRVGRDISLMGLDDNLDTQLSRLTCYSFNPRGTMTAALNAIVNPRLVSASRRTGGTRIAVIEGEIRERESVGRV
ncbi:MAG: GntR family transcriptional regulator [Chitinivibrionales bacterium]|nr:GntR family transcriptional regulator [Chitinivibrionales bacterium]